MMKEVIGRLWASVWISPAVLPAAATGRQRGLIYLLGGVEPMGRVRDSGRTQGICGFRGGVARADDRNRVGAFAVLLLGTISKMGSASEVG